MDITILERLLEERYKVRYKIEESDTYLVEDPLGVKYVAKILQKDLVDEGALELIKQINHPQISKLVELIDKDVYQVRIYTYMQGSTIYDEIMDEGVYSEEKARVFIKELAVLFDYLHSREKAIIYRDIHPKNIMIHNGKPYLIDLESSRIYKQEASNDTQVIGVVGFIAPEQYGFEQSSVRSDVYSLGVLAVFMLTGEYPSISSNRVDLKCLNISANLQKLLESMTAYDKKNRPKNMSAVVHYFEKKTVNWLALSGVVALLFVSVIIIGESRILDKKAVEIEQATAIEAKVEPEQAKAEETDVVNELVVDDTKVETVVETAAQAEDIDETITEETTTAESAIEEPAAEEPATEEPATEEPTTEEPTTEEPIAEETVAEDETSNRSSEQIVIGTANPEYSTTASGVAPEPIEGTVFYTDGSVEATSYMDPEDDPDFQTSLVKYFDGPWEELNFTKFYDEGTVDPISNTRVRFISDEQFVYLRFTYESTIVASTVAQIRVKFSSSTFIGRYQSATIKGHNDHILKIDKQQLSDAMQNESVVNIAYDLAKDTKIIVMVSREDVLKYIL